MEGRCSCLPGRTVSRKRCVGWGEGTPAPGLYVRLKRSSLWSFRSLSSFEGPKGPKGPKGHGRQGRGSITEVGGPDLPYTSQRGERMHRTNHVPRTQVTSNVGLRLTSDACCQSQYALGVKSKPILQSSRFWMQMLGWGLSALLAVGGALAQERVQAPTPAPSDAGVRPSTIIVPIGGTRPLEMKGRKIITRAENVNERVLEVRSVRDRPETLLLLGKDAGTSRLTLTAQDGSTETFEVIVQLDVEYLKSILQRAVPTANITLIPIHSSTVIISGTVNHAEDIPAILATAGAVLGGGAGAAGPGGDRVINRLTVAGVQQVQLDAVIAFVDRSLTRDMGVDWFSSGAHHSLASTISGFLIPGQIAGSATGGLQTAGSPNFTLTLMNSEETLDVALKALKDESLSKIMAQP